MPFHVLLNEPKSWGFDFSLTWIHNVAGNPEKIIHCGSRIAPGLLLVKQACLLLFIKAADSLSFGSPLSDPPHCICRLHWALHIALRDLGTGTTILILLLSLLLQLVISFVSDSGVLYLLSASTKLWQNYLL